MKGPRLNKRVFSLFIYTVQFYRPLKTNPNNITTQTSLSIDPTKDNKHQKQCSVWRSRFAQTLLLVLLSRLSFSLNELLALGLPVLHRPLVFRDICVFTGRQRLLRQSRYQRLQTPRVHLVLGHQALLQLLQHIELTMNPIARHIQ